MAGQRELALETEIQTLTQSLSDMERTLQEHYCDIGKMFLEMFEREGPEINREVDQIIETRKRLTVLRKEVQCPDCFTYNDHGSRYCSHCGKKLR